MSDLINNKIEEEIIDDAKKIVSLLNPTQSASSGVAIGENIIYYGVPGCGKSYTLSHTYAFTSTNMERTVFHPDYTYNDFVGQVLPKTKKGGISYSFVPGPFSRILKKAMNDKEHNYYLVIEEINRGNAPAIFGDIFQLLDRTNGISDYSINNEDIARVVFLKDEDIEDETKISIAESTPIQLPQNLFILATMNTSDQNVFTLDTAFKRRWQLKNIPNNISGCKLSNKPICDTFVLWSSFLGIINPLITESDNATISNEDKSLGGYFLKEDELSDVDKYAEKILLYLWNDAFKYNRSQIFKPEYNTLEKLIIGFKAVRFKVFIDSIVDKLMASIPTTPSTGAELAMFLNDKNVDAQSKYSEFINEFEKLNLQYTLGTTQNYIALRAPNNRVAAEIHLNKNDSRFYMYIKEPVDESNKIGNPLGFDNTWSLKYQIEASETTGSDILAKAVADSYNQVNK